MNIEKILHKFVKAIEDNYSWYSIEYLRSKLEEVLIAHTEPEEADHQTEEYRKHGAK